ncbi:MAG: hypothetical protein KBF88_01175 [Polyangiaceae bacterium]|nr:hypothetical protein [Polyangiaceae bacterium]
MGRKLSFPTADLDDVLSLANRNSSDEVISVVESHARVRKASERPISLSEAGALEMMRARLELGDFSGALEMAEVLLGKNETHAEAHACRAHCEQTLSQMYKARLGSLEAVPKMIVKRDQLRWLSLDHRAGFIVSLIDGSSSFETILDMANIPRLDCLRILAQLSEEQVISTR